MSQPIQTSPTTGKAGDLELEYVERVASRPKGYAYQEPSKSPRKTGPERRLVMKLDCLLIPLLALIYFVTFLVSITPFPLPPLEILDHPSFPTRSKLQSRIETVSEMDDSWAFRQNFI
jgi:hypothetical protein